MTWRGREGGRGEKRGKEGGRREGGRGEGRRKEEESEEWSKSKAENLGLVKKYLKMLGDR